MGIEAAIMVPHPPLIVPEVGRGDEKEVGSTLRAYHEAAKFLAAYKPETIVLLSPHQTMYADYFHISPGVGARGDFSRFRAPQVSMEVSYDTEFVSQLAWAASQRELSAGTLGERDSLLDHGTMVPLYYVNQYWKDYQLVRIGLSGLPLTDHYALGQCIRQTAEKLGRRTVIVASGDLSHRLKADGPYGFQAEGPEYDRRIMDVMGSADFGALFSFEESFLEAAGECGHRSFVIMAGAFDKTAVTVNRLSYEGPFGVGYGVCTYEPVGEDALRCFLEVYEEKVLRSRAEARNREDAYVRLARCTVEQYVRSQTTPTLDGARVSALRADDEQTLPDEMLCRRAGVFVSIKKEGNLRGCIGTISATTGSIAEEIIQNAVSAAVRDPRFSPITEKELKLLTISVDVLGDAEDIASPSELDVKRYGVIVTKGRRRGLLLPNLDGVRTIEEQLAIAKQKAGIDEADDDVSLQRFEVVRHD